MPIFVENGVYVIKRTLVLELSRTKYLYGEACRHVDDDQHHYGYQGDMSAQLVSLQSHFYISFWLLCDEQATASPVFVVMAQHLVGPTIYPAARSG